MANKKYVTPLLLIVPFLATWMLIVLGVWYPIGSLESLTHTPNIGAAIFVSLLVPFATVHILGSIEQKSFAKKGLLILGALGVLAWLVFTIWIFSGVKF